jgi:hypothetical protein
MDDHYEYHVVTIPPSGPQHQEVLDQFSREGWELVDSTPFGILGTVTRLTFRRPSHQGQIPPHPVLQMPSEPPSEPPKAARWLVWIVTIIGIGLLTAAMIF